MSSPSEPEDIVSISIERSFLPSFITEPLPNWRSIWDSAADRALLLSMEEPSTIRRAVTDIVVLLMARIRERDKRCRGGISVGSKCTPFVPCSQYVLLKWGVLSVFDPRCPSLK